MNCPRSSTAMPESTSFAAKSARISGPFPLLQKKILTSSSRPQGKHESQASVCSRASSLFIAIANSHSYRYRKWWFFRLTRNRWFVVESSPSGASFFRLTRCPLPPSAIRARFGCWGLFISLHPFPFLASPDISPLHALA